MVLEKGNQISKYVNENFASTEVNRVLFGCPEMSRSDAKDPYVLYRIILLTYIAIYSKWRHYGRKSFVYAKGKHAKNAFEVLQAAYKTQPFTLDLIVYVVSEGKRDANEYGADSFFFDFFSNDVDCRYSLAYEVLKYGMGEGFFREGGEQMQNRLMPMIGMAVLDLKFFKDLEILRIASGNSENTFLKFSGKEYDTGDLVVYRDSAMCILRDRFVVDNNVERHYQSLENQADIVTIEKIKI